MNRRVRFWAKCGAIETKLLDNLAPELSRLLRTRRFPRKIPEADIPYGKRDVR